MKIVRRQRCNHFEHPHYPRLLSEILQKRTIECETDLSLSLQDLYAPSLLLNIDIASTLIVEAILDQKKIVIVGDYDVDGATGIALSVRVLKALGCENVHYIVPNRLQDGYGLSPALVDRILCTNPDLLITVDNGISSVEGVRHAKEHGIRTIITDHHLPPDDLPEADAIVNPNLAGDAFPSKALAGVGVVFYLLLHVRASLVARKAFSGSVPNLAQYLDLVALGTVADVVPLDSNNRKLVQQGLLRIRKKCTVAGIRALALVSKKNLADLSTADIGFGLAPLLNAAGRLDDMTLGIECLLTDSDEEALRYAQRLLELNQERREIERSMVKEADQIVTRLALKEQALPGAIMLYDASWHQGVMGIVAARLKDAFYRPTLIFTDDQDGYIKGSGRSIPGFHLRDALGQVAAQSPGMISKFGGHAMAAGLSIQRAHFEQFKESFNEIVETELTDEMLQQVIYSDGDLSSYDFITETAALIKCVLPWGQHFPEPLFDNIFEVVSYRILKGEHIKFSLRLLDSDLVVDAIAFFKASLWSNSMQYLHCAFKLDINEWRGVKKLQLLIEHFSEHRTV